MLEKFKQDVWDFIHNPDYVKMAEMGEPAEKLWNAKTGLLLFFLNRMVHAEKAHAGLYDENYNIKAGKHAELLEDRMDADLFSYDEIVVQGDPHGHLDVFGGIDALINDDFIFCNIAFLLEPESWEMGNTNVLSNFPGIDSLAFSVVSRLFALWIFFETFKPSDIPDSISKCIDYAVTQVVMETSLAISVINQSGLKKDRALKQNIGKKKKGVESKQAVMAAYLKVKKSSWEDPDFPAARKAQAVKRQLEKNGVVLSARRVADILKELR